MILDYKLTKNDTGLQTVHEDKTLFTFNLLQHELVQQIAS
jgi:hypothetical protein